MTTTETTATENSTAENSDELSFDDNSIAAILDGEPETDDTAVNNEPTTPENTDTDEKKEQNTDNAGDTKDKILGKFENTDALIKSYQELEAKVTPLFQENADMKKFIEDIQLEKEQTARKQGYKSAKDMEEHFANIAYQNELVQFRADQFMSYVNECDYKDEVVALINQYRVNPTKELQESIEAEMPTRAIKALGAAERNFEIDKTVEYEERQKLEGQQQARDYLGQVITQHRERFDNPAFTQLFGLAFEAYGTNLKADALIELLDSYTKSEMQSELAKKNTKQELQNLTDNISNLSPNGQTAQTQTNVDIENMSKEEVDKLVRDLV